MAEYSIFFQRIIRFCGEWETGRRVKSGEEKETKLYRAKNIVRREVFIIFGLFFVLPSVVLKTLRVNKRDKKISFKVASNSIAFNLTYCRIV